MSVRAKVKPTKLPARRSGAPSPSASATSSVACESCPCSIAWRHEDARPRLLEPAERGEAAARPVGIGQERGHRHVEVAVAVEVGGERAVRSGQRGERVRHERVAPAVLEPAHAVVGADGRVVERRPVRGEHVEVAVADRGRRAGCRSSPTPAWARRRSPASRTRRRRGSGTRPPARAAVRRGPRSPAGRRRRGRPPPSRGRPCAGRARARRTAAPSSRSCGSRRAGASRGCRGRRPRRAGRGRRRRPRRRASTSVTRGSFSTSTRFSHLPSAVCRSHTTAPLLWSSGMKKPMSATRRSVRPSRSRSTAEARDRVRHLRDLAQLAGARRGSPARTSPWPMSQATTSGRPSPSRSTRRAPATIGTGAAPGGLIGRCSKRSGAASGAGHGSGSGSDSGARASK